MKKILKRLLTLLAIFFPAHHPANAQTPTTDTNPVTIQFETTQGPFTVQLFSDVPVTAKNFQDLAVSGFYDGLTFHRYVEGFVIQGGDPTGTGSGGSGKRINLEITDHKNVKGAMAMARTNDPNSATSQFFICLADLPSLDGSYAVFGEVVDGMDNVMKLRQGDKMTKVTVVSASAPTPTPAP